MENIDAWKVNSHTFKLIHTWNLHTTYNPYEERPWRGKEIWPMVWFAYNFFNPSLELVVFSQAKIDDY
jgi:hypothetical protein